MRMVVTCVMESQCYLYVAAVPTTRLVRVPCALSCGFLGSVCHSVPLFLVSGLAVSCHIARCHYVRWSGGIQTHRHSSISFWNVNWICSNAAVRNLNLAKCKHSGSYDKETPLIHVTEGETLAERRKKFEMK